MDIQHFCQCLLDLCERITIHALALGTNVWDWCYCEGVLAAS